jgi:hypothetical protein
MHPCNDLEASASHRDDGLVGESRGPSFSLNLSSSQPPARFPLRSAQMSTSAAAAAPQEQGFFSSLLSSVFTTYVVPSPSALLLSAHSETRISSLVAVRSLAAVGLFSSRLLQCSRRGGG